MGTMHQDGLHRGGWPGLKAAWLKIKQLPYQGASGPLTKRRRKWYPRGCFQEKRFLPGTNVRDPAKKRSPFPGWRMGHRPLRRAGWLAGCSLESFEYLELVFDRAGETGRLRQARGHAGSESLV